MDDARLPLAVCVTIGAFVCAVAHSWLSERRILPHVGARSQRIVRWVFHLPSAAWAIIGVAVLAATLRGEVPVTPAAAAALFAASAVGNAGGVGRLHFGAILLGLLAAACLVLALA